MVLILKKLLMLENLSIRFFYDYLLKYLLFVLEQMELKETYLYLVDDLMGLVEHLMGVEELHQMNLNYFY